MRRKKLKVRDINKNNSINVKGTINKIKEKEAKYTVFLVIFFMILFCGVGYLALSLNNKNVELNEKNQKLMGISTSASIATLTKEDVKSDEEGLDSDKYVINIENNLEENLIYELHFEEDEFIARKCECDMGTITDGSIKYSLDGKNIKTFTGEDMIIKTGNLSLGESESISITVWLDENLDSEHLGHFHGHFVLQKKD